MKKETLIVLTKEDLHKPYDNAAMNQNLSFTQFKLSKEDYEKASMIIFVDGGWCITLKNRYGSISQ